MKSLLQTAAITSALLLVPAFALAQDAGTAVTPPADATPGVMPADAEKPRAPAPLPAAKLPLQPEIRNTIQQGRENIRTIASSTRAEIRDIKENAQNFIGQRRDDIRTLIASSTPAMIRSMMGSSTPETRQQMREDSRMLIEQKKADVKTKIDAAKEKAKEKYSENVQTSVTNITDRLTNDANNLSTIAGRIDSRISELQAKGVNMDEAVTLLTAARADIAAAQDKITAVGAALTTALSSSAPKEKLAPVRTAVKAAEDALKAAKESLRNTFTAVKTAAATAPSTSTDTAPASSN